MSDSHDPILLKKRLASYFAVFFTMLVLTGVQVFISTLGISMTAKMALIMSIAAVEGLLVAAYFLHLNIEKKLIRDIVLVTCICFTILVIVTWCAMNDHTHL